MSAEIIHSDFGPQENKICHYFSTFYPSIGHEVMGPDAMILVFCFWCFFFSRKYFYLFIIYLLEANYYTILYWFRHTLTWIHHECTCVPHPEAPFMLSFKAAFSLSSFTFIKRLFTFCHKSGVISWSST